jgi:hypothetical protein
VSDTTRTDEPSARARLNHALAGLADGARYHLLAFLASPAGAKLLGELKDELVVDVRTSNPGERYPETAERLGISPQAVNAAVARHNRRNGTARKVQADA